MKRHYVVCQKLQKTKTKTKVKGLEKKFKIYVINKLSLKQSKKS